MEIRCKLSFEGHHSNRPLTFLEGVLYTTIGGVCYDLYDKRYCLSKMLSQINLQCFEK